ncbi:unnamed protein product, partial [Protopolystoma xenopodis]
MLARCALLREQHRLRLEPMRRQALPALHLHLSENGTSPLPPGWQRAPNTAYKSVEKPNASVNVSTIVTSGIALEFDGNNISRSNQNLLSTGQSVIGSTEEAGNCRSSTDASLLLESGDDAKNSAKTRQTRWDPPVYPWDADPEDKAALEGGNDENDPEAPYNWGCASRYQVTHEEIETMYQRMRQRLLERQCMELLHELAAKPGAPQGAAEQSFAIELYSLVHNTLRNFRDARCKYGRILNDEDLYFVTRRLAQAVIVKEIQKLHQAQAATASSIFSAPLMPEVTPTIRSRATLYVRKYMEAKGPVYVRRQAQAPILNTCPGISAGPGPGISSGQGAGQNTGVTSSQLPPTQGQPHLAAHPGHTLRVVAGIPVNQTHRRGPTG